MASSPELKIKIAVDGASTAASEIGKVSGQLGALGNTSSKAGDIGRSWRGLAADFAHVGQSVLLAKSAVDMAVNAVSGMVTGYVQASVASQKLASSLEFSAGSARGAAQEIEYLRRVSRDMGLDFGTASGAYAKFAASARSAGMSLGDTHKIFEGVSKAGARFGLSADEMSGAFLALGQMASKGVVSMEELRGQLGERLPGAFDLAAKAMGVTQAELIKLVESGKLAAADFLPAFARSLNENITAPTKNLQQDLNRLSSAWEDWKRSLADGAGGDSFAWLTRGLAESSAAMRLLGNEAGIVHKTLMAIGGFTLGAAANGAGADIAMAQEKARDRARELRAYIAPLQAQLDKISYLTPMQHEALRTAKRYLDDINTELAKLALRSGREAGIKLPNLKEQVEKQRSSEDARLKAYSDDTKFAPKAAKIAADIEKENKAFNMAVVGLQETDARYIAALKTHNERVAAIKAKGAEEATGNNERQRLVTSLKGQIAAFEEQGDALKKLTANETAYAKFKATSKLASDAEINALFERAIALEKSGAATAAAKKEEEDYQKLKEQNLRALAGELKSIEDQVDAQKKHNEEIGLTTEALAQLEQHRLDDAIATQEQAFAQAQKEGADMVELKLIDDKIAALRDLKSLKAEGAARQVVADEAKRAADDWKKFTDDIERSLTDSLMRSFESGENFGKTFVKSLQNTLKTTVLKVAVQAVVGDVMGAVGLGSGGSGSGSSIGSALSMGSNLSSMADPSKWSGGMSPFEAWDTLGDSYKTFSNLTESGIGMFDSAKIALDGTGKAFGNLAGYASAVFDVANGSYGKGIGGTIGTMFGGPVGGTIGSFIGDKVLGDDLGGLVQKAGGPQQGQYSQTTRDSFNISHTSSGGANLDSKALAASALAQVDALYAMAGRQKANVMIDQGYGFDPQGTSPDMKYRKINIEGKQLTSFDDRSVRGDTEGAAKRLANLTSTEIEAIAKAIDSPKLNETIQNLKNNFGNLEKAMAAYGKAQMTQQAILAATQSDEEAQRNTANSLFAAVGGAFNALNITMPDSVAGIHALVEGLDLTTKSGMDTLNTLTGLGPAFDQYIAAAKKVEADRREWQDKLDVLNGKTTEQELERAKTLASVSDETTKSLMRQVFAMQDQAAAAKEASSALENAAASARAVAAKQRDLDIQLMEARGDVHGATAAKRSDTLAGLENDSLRATQQQIWDALDAAQIESQRKSMQVQLLQAQGDTAGAEALQRQYALADIGDAGLKSLQQQIYAAQDLARQQEEARRAAEESARAAQQAAEAQARAAQQAAEAQARAQQQLIDGWQRTADAIMQTVRGLRGDLLGEERSFAAAQADYAIALAAARAGDQTAADQLPELARAVVDLGKVNSVTATEQALLTARTLAGLQDVVRGIGDKFNISIPAFASGGSFGGGLRLVGENGPELEVTGPSRIYSNAQTRSILSGGSDELLTEVRALRDENAHLRSVIETRLSKIESNTLATSKAVNGNPDAPILVEVAA